MKVINREKFMIGHENSIFRLSVVQYSNGTYEVAIERKTYGDNWDIDYYWMGQIFLTEDVYGGLTAEDVAATYEIVCRFYEDMAA